MSFQAADRHAIDDDGRVSTKIRPLHSFASVNDQIVPVITKALPNRIGGTRQSDEIRQPHGVILPMLFAPVDILRHSFGREARLE